MTRYKCINNIGYEHKLIDGKVYQGIEQDGIFADSPFLDVFDENKERIAVAHLSRFEEVTP